MTRRLRRRSEKIAFHHSFGRPMSTKRREGCAMERPCGSILGNGPMLEKFGQVLVIVTVPSTM